MGSRAEFEFSPADLWPGDPGDIIRIDETSLRSGLAAHGLEDLTELSRFLLRLHSEDEGLDLRLGAWWLDVRRATLQSIIGSAILVPVCLAAGVAIPTVLIPAILPFILALERMELKDSDRYLLARLAPALDQPRGPLELYASLPEDVRHEVSRVEFLDLLQRLRTAGELTRDGSWRYHLPPLDR